MIERYLYAARLRESRRKRKATCGGKKPSLKKKKKSSRPTKSKDGQKEDGLSEVVMQFSRKQMVCIELRKVQQQSGCSTVSLNLAIDALKPYVQFSLPRVEEADNLIKKISGATVLRLHGCVTKDCPTIWTPENDQTCCPLCGANR